MIYFYFQIDLENDDLDEFLRPKGALFNKWLPCGRNSSIELLPDDDENKIKVWFDRRGETKNGFVAYNYRERKVDTEIMSKQAKLDSGPLCGEAIYKNVSQEEIDAVKNDLIDSDDYIRIGKKIVKFLYPPLSNFIQLLRTRYGQYWLPELESWDSRKTVLTIYCNYLRLHWKTEKNQKWQRFQPTKQVLNFKCQIQTGSQYLTKEDWSNIKKQFSNEEITLSEILLTKSRSLYEEGHLRQALVEGVASLELAISDFISKSKNYSKPTTEAAKRFFDLPIKSQVAVIGTANSIVTQEILENTIKTIEIRNKIVHEGYIPEIDNISSSFQDLCSFIAALTGKGAFKFPELNTGNALTD